VSRIGRDSACLECTPHEHTESGVLFEQLFKGWRDDGESRLWCG